MDYVHLNIKKLDANAQVPTKKHKYDACYDLYTINSCTIPAGQFMKLNLGLAMEIPDGYVGIIKGRSGLTSSGVIVPTGTIDSNYRGEVGVTVYNTTNAPLDIETGYRIAQFCVQPAITIGFQEVNELTDSERGTNGFGSTGLK